MEIPTIKTTRLVLNAFRATDAQAVYNYASNPNVAKTVSWEAHGSIDDSLRFIKFTRDKCSFESGNIFHCWAIRKSDDDLAIGSISFSQPSEISGRIDYALAESEWGQGIMSEATLSVIRWGFDTIPQLRVIKSGGLSENTASLRVMEKCGMRLEKTYRVQFAKFNNEEREISDYCLTREEFENL
jgi:ribosomal-protein-alanine N-acetyltransferase